MKSTTFLTLSLAMSGSVAFSVDHLSRRQAIQAAIVGAVGPGLVSVFPANAVVEEETPRVVTRMGGLLVGSSTSSAV